MIKRLSRTVLTYKYLDAAPRSKSSHVVAGVYDNERAYLIYLDPL